MVWLGDKGMVCTVVEEGTCQVESALGRLQQEQALDIHHGPVSRPLEQTSLAHP